MKHRVKCITLLAVVVGCYDSDVECKDQRKLGDGKQLDECWNPPFNYCASGAGQAVTRACPPSETFCCEFHTTCVPCGWVKCLPLPSGACVGIPDGGNQCHGLAIQPSEDAVFCYDTL